MARFLRFMLINPMRNLTMAEWVTNQLDITGKSVCIDVMQQWVCGEEIPRYRQAVLQSLRLFLAGCAGI
ncbi:hypothetical protein PXH59_17420 [Xenorhabdus sp. SF857]|nr:hypothetical protein [Xenorhabdus sp. SF857]WFQ81602.1 hypothetical protein PXH59_17420 [Xenorhabdus sp. SF857]